MKHLILLHGATGARDQLAPLADRLSDTCQVHTLNFTGHGGRPFNERPFSIPAFADDVLEYMLGNGLEQANLFGYSMGGYVALYLAKHQPEKVETVTTMATKYHWDADTAAREIKMLDADKIELKIPAFAATLRARHAPNDWRELLSKTAGLMTELGGNNFLAPGELGDVAVPALIMLGDRDKMVGLDETLAVYKALPDARMAVLPATSHPIEQLNRDVWEVLMRNFLR